MTTTIMNNSIVGDAWIKSAQLAAPVQRVMADGVETGDFLTGPVRLSFPDLFVLPQASADNQNPKYGSILIFPPDTDFSIFYEEYNKVAAAKFADKYDATSQQYYGIRSPFRDQGEKAKFSGFTPGTPFITATSKFKPPVIDNRQNPIVDQSKVYAGVWAICSINAYSYHDPKNSGIAFGIQSVMIIGDDESLSGGGADAIATFQGVKGAIIAPPTSNPNGGMPPGVPAGAPGAPPTAGVPHAPAAAPGVPVAPPAASPRGPVPAGFATWAEYDALMG